LALTAGRTTSRCAGCGGMGRTVGSRPRSACRWTTRGRGWYARVGYRRTVCSAGALRGS